MEADAELSLSRVEEELIVGGGPCVAFRLWTYAGQEALHEYIYK